jgi:hypothetical protein
MALCLSGSVTISSLQSNGRGDRTMFDVSSFLDVLGRLSLAPYVTGATWQINRFIPEP